MIEADSTEPGKVRFSTELTQELEAIQEREVARPRVEVTPEAARQLEAWGVTATEVQELAELAGAYRYDQSREKLEGVGQRGGYVGQADDGRLEVVLPDYFDYADRSMGQCSEIEAKVLRDMHTSGWLEQLNQSLVAAGREMLLPWRLHGISRTHFNEEGDTHCWVGLGPLGTSPEELLTIDGSFREISMPPHNEYKARGGSMAPLRSGPRVTAAAIPVGTYRQEESGVVIKSVGGAAIGMSDDGRYAYQLSFVRSEQDATAIRPVIGVLPAEGPAATCLATENGFVWNQDRATLGEAAADVEALLEELARMPLTHDADKARRLRGEKTQIIYEDS